MHKPLRTRLPSREAIEDPETAKEVLERSFDRLHFATMVKSHLPRRNASESKAATGKQGELGNLLREVPDRRIRDAIGR
ncbi:MAG: hypothetical protein KGH94_04395 [Candidatus Micrarchaeota archaeon]|nr:hypothetical protein [Candidatus Micrarchaeota archaeon]